MQENPEAMLINYPHLWKIYPLKMGFRSANLDSAGECYSHKEASEGKNLGGLGSTHQ
jgi:hypothetical protein